MRRPHPRFDERRNAWVTNSGGRLKRLAPGPKNAETEQLAWEAFYAHMASLGHVVINGQAQITLGELADKYAAWMKKEVDADRMAEGTMDYYVRYLQKFLDAAGGLRPASEIKPIELEEYKTSWHSVQTVQRLFNWGAKMGLVDRNPVKSVERPPAGARERILSREECVRLLRSADREFRDFLLAMRQTIARPQEIRALQWEDYVTDPVPVFVLREFKAKRLRRDRKTLRIIPIDARLHRLLQRLRRTRPQPKDFIFLNSKGKPWTANAIRCRIKRLRRRVGLIPDENGEQIVAYSIRHTSATNAAFNGVRDKLLAEVMGHTKTSTTERYQHFDAGHLHEAIRRAHDNR